MEPESVVLVENVMGEIRVAARCMNDTTAGLGRLQESTWVVIGTRTMSPFSHDDRRET